MIFDQVHDAAKALQNFLRNHGPVTLLTGAESPTRAFPTIVMRWHTQTRCRLFDDNVPITETLQALSLD